jgi:hypothetical protein
MLFVDYYSMCVFTKRCMRTLCTAATAYHCMYTYTHCRCALFAVIAAAPAFVVERRTALQEMLNGAYGGHMFCFGKLLTHT